MKYSSPFEIEFNGMKNSQFDIILYDFPNLTLGVNNYQTYKVAGRRGELVGETECVGNAKIECQFSVTSDVFLPRIISIMEWLSGTGVLKTSDDPNCYYNVLKVDYGDIERELRRFGIFSVNFTVDPYLYRIDGDSEYDSISFNPYSKCMPIYKITGEGMCTLTANGKTMTANVGQNLTIDTGRMLAYRQDGTMQNTAVTGDYTDLWLPHGACSISITSGFGMLIIPKWGYNL